MKIVVQKFGGTSVATRDGREAAAKRVKEIAAEGYAVVVVVSAMGRKGDPYATDTLINMVKDIYPETSPRELDLLTSCGEIISTVVMVNTLKNLGLNSIGLTGGQAGIITDLHFTDAHILRVEPEHVLRHLKRGEVVVVAGFQGLAETGDITTLGRGGSDTTAAALGVALKAERVEIFTDVSGVKTADPRLVPEAKTLTHMTYEEIVQMAYEGAKVVHPRAVEIAMKGNVPLLVKNTFEEKSKGTLITHVSEITKAWPDMRKGRLITGVTHIENMAKVTVFVEENTPEKDLKIFELLASHGISLDMITVTPERKSFIVKDEVAEQARFLLQEAGLDVEVLLSCAKVTVVGTGMRGIPGVMANVVQALTRQNIEVLLSVDSHATISCLIRGDKLAAAVKALHKQFHLE